MSKEKVDVKKVIVEAAVLSRKVKELTAELEAKKEVIRGEALRMWEHRVNLEETNVKIETDEGVCTVAFPHDKPKFNDGVMVGDISGLRKLIGKTSWNGMFQPTIKFQSSAIDVWNRLSNAHRTVLKKLITWEDQSPTVTLPK
jgi:hypothetical protein